MEPYKEEMDYTIISKTDDVEIMSHAVCMPCPAQGHINSMLQLAKLLHHTAGFHITFVHSDTNYARILATSGPTSLAGSRHFRFESIPDGIANSDDSPLSGQDVSKLCIAIRKNMVGPFRELVKRLNETPSGAPRVTCIVADSLANFAVDVASEFGIPDVLFSAVSACGFMAFFSLKELLDKGIIPVKSESDLSNGYLDTPIDFIPGLTNMRLRDLTSFVQTTDPNEIFLNFCKDEAQDALKAATIIFNTFDDLEGRVLEALSSLFPSVYAVGPLNLLCHRILDDTLSTIGSSMWEEDSICLHWLDGRAPGSVIYLNFGSIAVMSGRYLIEFAWGLANSGYNFLWVIRPELVMGESTALPEEFLLETRERRFITRWCPQEKVLRHPSIGGFLTHCGWNSIMESLTAGVPMICWPYFGDQQINCRYLCNEWGVGVEIEGDVEREGVEKVIRVVMGGEKGTEMRRMATKWKGRAMEATEPKGKSFLNLKKVANKVVLQRERF